MAAVDTWPISFIIKYGVTKMKLKNVRIGQTDGFFCESSKLSGVCPVIPLAAAKNISLKPTVVGSDFDTPSI